MFLVSAKVCNDNQTTVDTNLAFKNAHLALKGKITGILTIEQILQSPISGIAQDKSAAKAILCESATDIAGIVFAFADATNNNTLKQAVNFSYSDLIRKRDDQFAPACAAIKTAATDNLAALADYGIIADTLTDFQ